MNDKWQPIDKTTPVDYLIFIVYWTEDEGVVARGYYYSEKKCWLDMYDEEFEYEPTHWMDMEFPSLPPRPETK